MSGYFVTGTDTGVGKSLVSAALLHLYAEQGLRVIGMKPVAAGCAPGEVNEDVALLRAASNVDVPLEWINPYSFEPAIAPHIAARQLGIQMDIGCIDNAYRQLSRNADLVVVEGAGGLLVPLNDTETFADLVERMNLPVILVVGMRLGCLNHALLTVEAISSRSLELAGWVANQLDPDMRFYDQVLNALTERISSPLLGVLPYLATTNNPIPVKWVSYPIIS